MFQEYYLKHKILKLITDREVTGVPFIHDFPHQHHFFTESSWTLETQANDALRGFHRQMEHFLTDMSNLIEQQNEPKKQKSRGCFGSALGRLI